MRLIALIVGVVVLLGVAAFMADSGSAPRSFPPTTVDTVAPPPR